MRLSKAKNSTNTVCWKPCRDHKSVQRKVSWLRWQQLQWLKVSRPGLRTGCSYWLKAPVLARELETTLLAQFSLPYPGSANTKCSVIAGSRSLPWKNRGDQGWKGGRIKQEEGERGCTKISGLERVAQSEQQWLRVPDVAEEQCSWLEIITSESKKKFFSCWQTCTVV